MNLLIVESPAKCKTIQKYLGDNFIVKASYGHFRNLADKNMGIDVNNNFQPTYDEDKEKKKHIVDLKKSAKEASKVYLASDDDREGEAIAWHLAEVLKLNINTTPRIIFHEITKNALTKALENPTRVNMNVVHSQQARQISDKLIGYELSPVLWKHIQRGLSAGRVQSVVTMLVMEKEKEIKNFKSEGYYDVAGQFEYQYKYLQEGKEADGEKAGKFIINTSYSKDLESHQEAKELLELSQHSDFIIDDINTNVRERKPSPPFITSTLQQEAGTKLGLSAKQTMSVAQKLYEKGKITYMRTDSTLLSDHIINEIKGHILEKYGEEYLKVRQYNKKVKGSQDAHEAIRCTRVNEINLEGDFTPVEKKLYQMIWRRTVASQMSPQKLEELVVMIKLKKKTENTNDSDSGNHDKIDTDANSEVDKNGISETSDSDSDSDSTEKDEGKEGETDTEIVIKNKKSEDKEPKSEDKEPKSEDKEPKSKDKESESDDKESEDKASESDSNSKEDDKESETDSKEDKKENKMNLDKLLVKFEKGRFRGIFQKEIFPGYTIVYQYKNIDTETAADDDYEESVDQSSYDNVKKYLKEDQPVNYCEIIAKEKFTQPPGRYTEASLIKKLESNGIGRPSTYASMVTLIQDRGYVVKDNKTGTKVNTKILRLDSGNISEQSVSVTTKSEKNKLFPTDIGMIVTQFLQREFPRL